MQPRFYLAEGLVIQREGRQLEYLRRTDQAIYFEDPKSGDIEKLLEKQFWEEYTEKKLAIVDALSTEKSLIFPSQDASTLPPAVSDKQKEAHQRKLEYVRGMQFRGITQGQIAKIEEAIKEIAQQIGDPKIPKKGTVAFWMRKLGRARDDVYALMSKQAAELKRESQDPDHEALIKEVLDEYLEEAPKSPLSDAYQDRYLPALEAKNAERLCDGHVPFKAVSDRTFHRRFNDIDKYDVAVARLGRQEARRAFRMVRGHMPGKRPLDFVEIDHAKLRLWVIDDKLLLPLGRPWVTVIRDRVSRMVLGIYVSFRGPSLASIFGGIRHSLSPAHAELKKFFPELKHEWMAFGPGIIYVSDNGLDFRSPQYRRAILELGGYYSYCRSRTPWHKPFIERVFRSLRAELLESQPGQVFRGLSYNKDYNPKEDAVVRFSTLVFLLLKWAVDYHPYKPTGRKKARPIDLWMDQIGDVPIGNVPNPDALSIILGRREKGVLGHEGIQYRHLRYADDGLKELYDVVGKREVEYALSEEDLGQIHVRDERSNQWLPVSCTRPDYAEGLSLSQHQLIVRQANAELDRRVDIEGLIGVRRNIQTRFADELVNKENADKARIARYCGVDSAAVVAGKERSVSDILLPPSSTSLHNTSISGAAGSEKIIIPDAAFSDVPILQWGVR